MKMDVGVLGMGKSDPYAIVTVGSQEFRTKTISNTINPKWDFYCEVSMKGLKVCGDDIVRLELVDLGN